MCVRTTGPRGIVKITRYVAAHDVGKAFNPFSIRQQVEGGVVMATGAVFTEELLIDKATGLPLNPNLLDYRPLSIKDAPLAEVIEARQQRVIPPLHLLGRNLLDAGHHLPDVSERILQLAAPLAVELVLDRLRQLRAGDAEQHRADLRRRLGSVKRLEQGVEALERQGQVRPALGARDGVDLVDDHRLDAAQRLARL